MFIYNIIYNINIGLVGWFLWISPLSWIRDFIGMRLTPLEIYIFFGLIHPGIPKTFTLLLQPPPPWIFPLISSTGGGLQFFFEKNPMLYLSSSSGPRQITMQKYWKLKYKILTVMSKVNYVTILFTRDLRFKLNLRVK